MKGTIVVCCFRDMVVEKLGSPTWERVLEMSGIPRDTVFKPTEDASDEVVLEVLHNLCKVLNISIQEATEAFGEYWISCYAPKLYGNFNILSTNSRELVTKLNEIHSKVIKTMKDAPPPKFRLTWKDEDNLLITYDAKWTLAIFFIGLIKGVGRYYDEEISVNMWSSNQMLVKFPPIAYASAEADEFCLEERKAYQ